MDFPTIDLKATGKKIKGLCKNAGFTPNQIKRLLNLSCVQTIYKWFSGENVPSIENFYALSLLLGVSMEELLIVKKASDHSLFWQKNVFLIVDTNYLYQERMHCYMERQAG